METGTLYIVATPIGNLEDITFRAVRILKEVSIVFCEDTRTTRVLFNKYDIRTQTDSFHAQSPISKISRIAELLNAGRSVALVSDAGTPSISDPGAMLVTKIYELLGKNAKVVAIPGASALTSALSIAGAPVHEFTFLGFLPHKKGRATLMKEIESSERTFVFYESPHRIEKALESLSNMEKFVVVARELTKIYEEVVRGSSKEVFDYFKVNADKIRGEFVVIVSPLVSNKPETAIME